MKSLFSLLAILAALFVVERAFISAESFTEGVRVSPDIATLNLAVIGIRLNCCSVVLRGKYEAK